MMAKRGQIAIWVILAVLIVAVFAVLMMIKQNPFSGQRDEFNPNLMIRNCMRDASEEALSKLIPNAGFISPTNTILYNNQKVTYLCYNKGNYQPCVNQHPVLLIEMQNEFQTYIKPKIDLCLNDVESELKKRGYETSVDKDAKLNVEFGPGRVYVGLNNKVSFSRDQSSTNYDSFKMEMSSPVYGLIVVASEIASQEASYCYFEYVGYMLLNPDYDIIKTTIQNSTRVYVITDKKSGIEMPIAIRGCTIPAGI